MVWVVKKPSVTEELVCCAWCGLVYLGVCYFLSPLEPIMTNYDLTNRKQ